MTNNLKFDTTKFFFEPFFREYIKNNQKYIKSYIDELNLDDLYRHADLYNDINGVLVTSRLTRLLYNIDIDPLDYLTEVPDYFMANVQTRMNLILPNNITAINNFAFFESWLHSLTIPTTCNYFGGRIFEGCKNLGYINYKGTISEFRSIRKDTKWRLNIESSPVWVKCVDGIYNIDDV